eukprot:m.45025 g.45025  ORF g.45025 m.45025 type:complete len:662 (-) comp5856_c0_seq3:193-2178(-)
MQPFPHLTVLSSYHARPACADLLSSATRVSIECDEHAHLLPPGQQECWRDLTQAYFIDRDPDLFAIILNYLRTKRINLQHVNPSVLRHEAEFYGITSLIQKLDICFGHSACGGILFNAFLPAPPEYGGVVGIAGSHNIVAVAQEHIVTCWSFSESAGWEVIGRSPRIEQHIDFVAVNVRLNASMRNETIVAIACDTRIRLWDSSVGRRTSTLVSATAPAAWSADDITEADLPVLDLSVRVDALFYIGNQLVAISKTGRVGIRHAMTQQWQVQEVQRITSFERCGLLLLLGCADGSLYYVDLEKFPLRMKDNDLLVNHLYADSAREAITALSVYASPVSSVERCLEIAYGTQSGTVRVIIQHPETVGQAPLLFQTFSVHRSPVVGIMLSEKFLVSVCAQNNHVRSWRLGRFRGRISTQPGSLPLASFNVASFDPTCVGPYGDRDQEQVFMQRVVSNTNQLLVLHAATGERICMIEGIDTASITHTFVLECGLSSRIGSRPRRFLLSGHENGAVQVWDLMTALEAFNARTAKAPTRETGQFDVADDQALLAMLDTFDFMAPLPHPNATPPAPCSAVGHGGSHRCTSPPSLAGPATASSSPPGVPMMHRSTSRSTSPPGIASAQRSTSPTRGSAAPPPRVVLHGSGQSGQGGQGGQGVVASTTC